MVSLRAAALNEASHVDARRPSGCSMARLTSFFMHQWVRLIVRPSPRLGRDRRARSSGRANVFGTRLRIDACAPLIIRRSRCKLWLKIAGDDMNGRVRQRISWGVLCVAGWSCGGKVELAAHASDSTTTSTGGANSTPTTTLPLATPTTSASTRPPPRCNPGTSVFYAASSYVYDVAQDDEWLYIQTAEELFRLSKDGSGWTQTLAVEAASSALQGQNRLAVHSDTLYWGHGNDGSIWRARVGSGPEPFLSGTEFADQARGLLVVDDLLYFLRDRRANVIDLVEGNRCLELEVTSHFVADTDGYYFERDRDQSSGELLLSGTSTNSERQWDARLPPTSSLLGVDGDSIYYLVSEGNGNSLQRRGKFGERDELITTSELLDDDLNLVVDGNDVFWSLEGSLYHVRIGQGAVPELVNRQFRYDTDDYGGFILIDADYVYWQANVDDVLREDRYPLPILRTCRAGLGQ